MKNPKCEQGKTKNQKVGVGCMKSKTGKGAHSAEGTNDLSPNKNQATVRGTEAA